MRLMTMAFAVVCLGMAVPASESANARVAAVRVDWNRDIGPIKPMHAVGQPPALGFCNRKESFALMHYLTEAGVPYSRLHDVGGAYGKNIFVDIPNIFRDFSADPSNPESYDFAFTDLLLRGIVDAGVEPYFRLGVTIENAFKVKSYRIFPPADPEKWARICEGIVRHYTEGWANGFKWKITYWEIWNEPDSNEDPLGSPMWRGTQAQYFELYEAASKHLKSKFPHLKIGGYGGCGFAGLTTKLSDTNRMVRLKYRIRFFDDFLAFVKRTGSPLDFYSYHSYQSVQDTMKHMRYVRDRLDKAGFVSTETHLNEWRPGGENGSAVLAARIAAMMLGGQQGPLDISMIYDARCGIGRYSPLFNPDTFKPRNAYYALKSFNKLYSLGRSVRLDGVPEDVYAAAAKNGAGKGAVMIANITGREVPVSLDISGARVSSCRLTDATHTDAEVQMPESLPVDSFILISCEMD